MAKGSLAKDLCDCVVAIRIPLIIYIYIEFAWRGEELKNIPFFYEPCYYI